MLRESAESYTGINRRQKRKRNRRQSQVYWRSDGYYKAGSKKIDLKIRLDEPEQP